MSDFLDFEVKVGCVISSSSSDFEVQAILGSGAFGEVAQCRKVATGETVALKVLREKDCSEEAKHEVTILKLLRRLHCEKYNIVAWNDSFDFRGRFCFEFEKLDIDLFHYIDMSPHLSLNLSEIRPILQQLATALQFLDRAGIIHADLKPENIMVVDRAQQPVKVKIIDFGLATCRPAEWTGLTLQTLSFRSPEILLGAPFNEAIQVWSLGCIAAEMLTANELFPGEDEFDMMRLITSAVGNPPDHLLSAGLHSKKFFSVSHTEEGKLVWSFKGPGKRAHNSRSKHSLSDLLKIKTTKDSLDKNVRATECDQAAFVQLLAEMLMVDPAERITASRILGHPFLSMSHLQGTFSDVFHVKLSARMMGFPQSWPDVADRDLDQETVPSDSTTSAEDHSVSEEDHPAEPNTSCGPPITTDTAITVSPGRKRKRSDDDPEAGHGSSDRPPVSKKQRTDTAIPTNTNIPMNPGRKRKRSADGDPEAGHGSSDGPPVSKKQRTDTAIPTNTNIAVSPGRKRKRSDDDPEAGHGSSDGPPVSKKQRTDTAIPTNTNIPMNPGRKRKRSDDDPEAGHGSSDRPPVSKKQRTDTAI